jgi:hypothetical protein
VHDRVGDRGTGGCDGSGGRIPAERVFARARGAPHDWDHAMPACLEGGDQRRADEAAGTGDRDDHAIAPPSTV